MKQQIPHYRDRFKTTIKYCTYCHRVEELPNNTIDCPGCGLAPMYFWDSPFKFQTYLRNFKPTYLNIIDEHLQYLLDEILEEEKGKNAAI